MATAAIEVANSPTSGGGMSKIGWLLSGAAILFLGTDAIAKIVLPAMMAAYTPPQLRIPADVGFYRLLGSILALSTVLYAVPRTALLGAIMLSAYLGGAIATNLIAGTPLVTNTLFGVYLGLAVWGGLYLREPRLRALLPPRN